MFIEILFNNIDVKIAFWRGDPVDASDPVKTSGQPTVFDKNHRLGWSDFKISRSKL